MKMKGRASGVKLISNLSVLPYKLWMLNIRQCVKC